MTDERRQRDISIAKKLGWTVERVGGSLWRLLRPDGNPVHMSTRREEDVCWKLIPQFSTDPAACMALLVEVMGRGWLIIGGSCDEQGATLRIWNEPDIDILRTSTLTDPALAFADAVSQACDEALEAGG